MKKRIGTLALALALVFSLSMSASAAVRWDQIGDCNMWLTFSGSTAECYVSITCDSEIKLMAVTVYLQKQESNGSYSNVKIWSEEVRGNTFRLDDSVTGCASGKYRLMVSAAAYDGNGGKESITNETYASC